MSDKKNSKDPLLYIDREFMDLMEDLVKVKKSELKGNGSKSGKS